MSSMFRIASRAAKTLATRWFPWLVLGLILIGFSLNEILNRTLLETSSLRGNGLFWVSFGVISGIYALIVFRLDALYNQREQLRKRIQEGESIVAASDKRLEAIFNVSQKFVEANDENEVIEPVLRLIIELIGARGVTFVPLDEHGQPLSAISHGENQPSMLKAWIEYMASPKIRQRCSSCESQDSLESRGRCPMLTGPLINDRSIYCLPVRRGELEYGVVTITFTESDQLESKSYSFLRALLDETALGLESIRLRRRELAALREMQVLREKTDLNGLLRNYLDNIIRTLEVDFAVMFLKNPLTAGARNEKNQTVLTKGELPDNSLPIVEGLMQGVISSKEPVILGDVGGGPSALPEPLSLAAVPLLLAEQEALGVVLVGNRKTRRINQRQLALLQTIAGQVVLVVQNSRLMAELEYKTLIEERSRLAREIHDGLAQTLGLLKLQIAQIRSNLGRGEIDRSLHLIDVTYDTLNEAYEDARQAIDGLRISPVEQGIRTWLEQILMDFQEVTGIAFEIQDRELQTELPSEVHVQLIRIVQEALSNVRKHAQASRVWVEFLENESEIVLEVRDDGMGFSPEDVSQPSKHGLRGMQERANLIGANIKVISRNEEGTVVRLAKRTSQYNEVVF